MRDQEGTGPPIEHIEQVETRLAGRHAKVGNSNDVAPDDAALMLGKCLKELEHDGLVSKTELAVGKVRRVKYALTPQGWRLLPTLKELYQWGKEHLGVESVCQQG